MRPLLPREECGSTDCVPDVRSHRQGSSEPVRAWVAKRLVSEEQKLLQNLKDAIKLGDLAGTAHYRRHHKIIRVWENNTSTSTSTRRRRRRRRANDTTGRKKNSQKQNAAKKRKKTQNTKSSPPAAFPPQGRGSTISESVLGRGDHPKRPLPSVLDSDVGLRTPAMPSRTPLYSRRSGRIQRQVLSVLVLVLLV